MPFSRLLGTIRRRPREAPRAGVASTHVVWIGRSVVAEAQTGSESHRPDETGGILVGYRVGGQSVICALIGPGPKATHEPWQFRPDPVWQERELAHVFRRSGGIHTYLGDWHSHPSGSGRPSARDKKTARHIAEHADARLPEPLMMVVSRDRDEWKPLVYVYERSSLVRCRVVIFTDLDGTA